MFKSINLEQIEQFYNENFNCKFDIKKFVDDFIVEYNNVNQSNEPYIKSANDSTTSYLIYKLFKVIKSCDMEKYLNLTLNLNTFIGLDAVIGKNFNIYHSKNIHIANNVVIGDNCTLKDNIKIGSSNNAPKILNNVTILSNVNIFGNIIVGNNVTIKDNCFVTDNIDDDSQVGIVNQLQVVSKTSKNYLPSQTLNIYGVIPKFKNTIVIVGDGFYNPIVNFKCDNKELEYVISYWDKNKIIVKFKNTKPIKNKKIIITILSNRTKITILNSAGLNKTLSTLQQ